MEKVTVYYFRGFSIVSGQFHNSPRMATLEFITKHNYEPLKETAIEVNRADLDGDGFYTPPQSKKNPDSKS
jgi:hypothetical protein